LEGWPERDPLPESLDLRAAGPHQEDHPAGSFRLTGEPIVEDLDRQAKKWIWPDDSRAFVPSSMLDAELPLPPTLTVVAEGGGAVQERLAAWAEERGYAAWSPHAEDFAFIQGVRLIIWSLAGTALGVGLLVLALGAGDRARERRRSVARQIMVGVPAKVLRVSQFAQTLLPALAAVVLALGAGVLGSRAYATTSQDMAALDGKAWAVIVGVSVAGTLLAALTAVPLIRTRLTPDLLRRE
jgi:hypothetical protein